MERQRPRGGYLAAQRRQNGETLGQKVRSFFKFKKAGGIVIQSADGQRWAYTDRPLPNRVSVQPDLSETKKWHDKRAMQWLAASAVAAIVVSTELITNHPETTTEWVATSLELGALGVAGGMTLRHARASFKETVNETATKDQ